MWAFTVWSFVLVASVVAQNLDEVQVALVKQTLAQNAKQSWEIGTRAQALLELDTPSLSAVTHGASVPPPRPLNASTNDTLADVLTIARDAVLALPPGFAANATGQPLVDGDGSAGDPASIGVAVLLANWTGLPGADYGGAAEAQLRYLTNSVPATSDGAISHRVSEVQLWSDSVFMVPPFLAYLGVTTNNVSMVNEAYNQIRLYRNYLRDSSGAWRHITLGSFNDTGHWSTGNGWAAAGMLRVLGTMQNSPMSRSFKKQMNDLENWVFEIQRAMYSNITSSGLFRNYNDDASSFEDASSTALIASTVYRLSLLAGRHTYLPFAERSRMALFASNGTSPAASAAAAVAVPRTASAPSSHSSIAFAMTSSRSIRRRQVATSGAPSNGQTSSNPSSVAATSSSASASSQATSMAFATDPHFTTDGWLTPVVNPESITAPGSQSPEGQAFVLMMESAYRDWVAAGSVGANGARAIAASWRVLAAGLVVAVLALM